MDDMQVVLYLRMVAARVLTRGAVQPAKIDANMWRNKLACVTEKTHFDANSLFFQRDERSYSCHCPGLVVACAAAMAPVRFIHGLPPSLALSLPVFLPLTLRFAHVNPNKLGTAELAQRTPNIPSRVSDNQPRSFSSRSPTFCVTATTPSPGLRRRATW